MGSTLKMWRGGADAKPQKRRVLLSSVYEDSCLILYTYCVKTKRTYKFSTLGYSGQSPFDVIK